MDSGNLAVRPRSSFLQIELNFYATKMAVVQAWRLCRHRGRLRVAKTRPPCPSSCAVAPLGRQQQSRAWAVRAHAFGRLQVSSVVAPIPKSEAPTDNRMFIAFSVATNSRMDSGDVADPTAFDLVPFCFRIACSGFVQSFL